MTRRSFLLSALAAGTRARAATRPNIVLILADDFGAECVGAYGGTSYRTPHLDSLAATGVRFAQAHSTPLCTPTRLQLMTGQLNFRNWKAFGIMDPKEQTFGHWMRAAGYKTCIAGKWQFWSYNPPDYEPEWRAKGQRIEDAGFDDYSVWHAGHTEDKGSRHGDPTVYEDGVLKKNLRGEFGDDLFCDFAGRFMERNRGRPFFVYYPMTLTHDPFNPTPKSASWTTARLKANTSNFKDMVEYLDSTVGRLVAKIDALGLRENTLILFYGDNGTSQSITSRVGSRGVKGGKNLTLDTGTMVPLIANWKGTSKAGSVSDDLVDSTDFVPTIFEAAGVPAPKGVTLDGRSFLPQIRGQKGNPRDAIYWWYDPRPGWDKDKFRRVRYSRDKRFKLYEDGRLFEPAVDPDETQPIAAGSGGSEAESSRRRLGRLMADMRAKEKAVRRE
ncbi:MAG: sulfatase-like hydrolase/transferase [Bryobacteraceae bacterium]|nr:sulfatase-like hydrolase/transferase [Bryobacteraceae bacterium]